MPTNDAVDHLVRPHVATTEDKYLQPSSSRYEVTYLPDEMPPEVARIVVGAQRLFAARSMTEHCDLMGLLSRDVVWDAPPILTARKGHLRVAAYWAKSIAHLRLEPSLVVVRQVAFQRHLVEVVGTVYFAPKRTWLLPATLLLPREVPLRATIKLGVRGPLQTGQIEMILGRLHNVPVPPALLRTINGLGMGGLLHLTEPLWSWGVWLLGDNFYSNRRSRNALPSGPTTNGGVGMQYPSQRTHATAPGAYGSTLPGAGAEGTGYWGSGAEPVPSAGGAVAGVAGAAGTAVGAARGVASAAADTVADIGSAAVSSVLDLGSFAFNSVVDTLSMAARMAQDYAGAAVETAADAARTAADVAAGAADTAGANYQAARVGTYAAVDSNVRGTAERAAGAVEEAADSARAGYGRGKVEGYDAGIKVATPQVQPVTARAPAGVRAW